MPKRRSVLFDGGGRVYILRIDAQIDSGAILKPDIAETLVRHFLDVTATVSSTNLTFSPPHFCREKIANRQFFVWLLRPQCHDHISGSSVIS